ncbi:ubiquitin carboxyl-terminal hydrolase 37 isoform X1 [Ranitomeya variabilis]|uniref:ubiquitin carboxyl-terminal hydrolase 37 isoform X1 n=1 Tax=Ranitomeya variabilis TaxID=490064 RepID=UPI0040577AFC
MAAALSLHGSIRIHCLNMGTSKWKEGKCEVIEKDNKFTLVINFNAGGVPSKFQLNQNIKNIVLRPVGGKQSRLLLTMKDSSSLTIDKVLSKEAEQLKHLLEFINQEKAQIAKPTQGSASFGGILGNRSIHRESIRPLTNNRSQTPTKRVGFDGKDETPVKKPLNNNGRIPGKTSPKSILPSRNTPMTSTPHRTGLMETRSEKRKRLLSSPEIEDYPKENDSSTTNKTLNDPSRKFLNSSREKRLNVKQAEENRPGLMSLQSSSFYSSRLTSKDYSAGNSCPERTPGSIQTPTAKRSLILPTQPSPLSVKKLRPNQDYAGWNRQRVLSTHPQPQQLQGFSNLGNTCYMNSILQSLFSLQPFANDLLKQGIPYKKIPLNALIRRFAFLLAKKDVCSAEMKKDLLKKVKSAISATAERFSGYMQNDAHEFLSQCLDQLKEDMGKLNKKWQTELSLEDDRPGNKAGGDDIAATHGYTCPVICNFEFEAQHSIICKICGEKVTKREQFNDLSIDLPRRKKLFPCRSIQDSLDLFFRKEDLEYSCEKCNGKSAVVVHKFSCLPRVLILHLKRYSFNVSLSLNNKVGQRVVIPRYLTLSSHCTESTRPPVPLCCSAQAAANSRPLKTSQMVNSFSVGSASVRKQSLKCTSNVSIYLDSESEDEVLKRSVVSQRAIICAIKDQSSEDADKKLNLENLKCPDVIDTSFDEMNDDEMMAAVLEMTRKEESLHVHNEHEEEKLASSPDTGFGGDEDMHETVETMETIEEEKSKAVKESGAGQYSDLTKDFDENKENKTPNASQNDTDWMQYELEREREEQELQQALAQSLQEHEARELSEDDDLKRATELSLQEFNSSFLDGAMSDEDSGNEDVLDMEYTEEEAEELKKNAESGELPHSYRLVSVVSHIGSSSSSGHYISDAYDTKKQSWFTYNDLAVSRTQETTVQNERDRSGYIFFYMHKEIFDEMIEEEKKAQASSTDPNRSSSRPQL